MECCNVCDYKSQNNEVYLSTMKTINSFDTIRKPYLPQSPGNALKRSPTSILKNKTTNNCEGQTCSLAFCPNQDRITSLRITQDLKPKPQPTFKCAPQKDVPKENSCVRKYQGFENGCRSQSLGKSQERISSGQMCNRCGNSLSVNSLSLEGAPICGNPMNLVTFAEPETQNESLNTHEAFYSENFRCPICSGYLSPSCSDQLQMQTSSDLGIDYCYCSQTPNPPEQARLPDQADSLTFSNCSCVGQQEETRTGETRSSRDAAEKEPNLEDRGFQMPDPVIRKVFQGGGTSSSDGSVAFNNSCDHSYASESESIEQCAPWLLPQSTFGAPPFPSPDPFSAFPPPNCVDANSFRAVQQPRSPPMPTCALNPCFCGANFSDVLQSQSVYMTDYRPFVPVSNQTFDPAGLGCQPATFGGGCRCQDMPLGGGFGASCSCSCPCSCCSDPCPISPWFGQCPPSWLAPTNPCCYPPEAVCCDSPCLLLCNPSVPLNGCCMPPPNCGF
ncbi:uncharacterized protein LOC108093416 [Drosophila ficusphila]|uniref:uncharacterized protein LOC108093416 n=1 Tax=Drosophila ficusphila TaxID=30025 RepID=UPI0007E64600|nr:uncharacterized protein LOC108093416 [Drosophila ficusphila]